VVKIRNSIKVTYDLTMVLLFVYMIYTNTGAVRWGLIVLGTIVLIIGFCNWYLGLRIKWLDRELFKVKWEGFRLGRRVLRQKRRLRRLKGSA